MSKKCFDNCILFDKRWYCYNSETKRVEVVTTKAVEPKDIPVEAAA